MKYFARYIAAAAIALGCMNAFAQALPNKPLTIVSAYPPGGGGDVIARLLGPKLSQKIGQPVVIDSKPGASGNIATDIMLRSPADGSSILINNSTLVLNAALGMPQNFKVQTDLKYIAAVASTPIAIAVHPSIPATNVQQLVAYIHKKKDVSYSSCGNGSPQHLAGAQFAQLAKLEVIHVPYKGCAPAVMDGVAGQVPVLFNTIPNLENQVKAGKLRFIAVAAQERLPFKPELPTVAESTGFEGFDADVWFGFIGSSRLPAAIAKRLEQEIIALVEDKEMQKELTDRLITPRILNSEQFEKQAKKDLATIKKVADELNIKLD